MNIKIIETIGPENVVFDFKPINPGIYEAHFNKNGAVSVYNDDGVKIGVKLNEFLFLSKEDLFEWIKIVEPGYPGVIKDDKPIDDPVDKYKDFYNQIIQLHKTGDMDRVFEFISVFKWISAYERNVVR